MPKFEIGEVAIVNAPEDEKHGAEVEIYTGLMPDEFFETEDRLSKGECYGIAYSDGCKGWAAPKYLRKKKPPESKDITETREAIKNGTYNLGWIPEVEHARD